MATAEQLASAVTKRLVDSIDEELKEIEKKLRKVDPLIAQRTKLQAARRALLNERSTTAGGGRGLSQAEVVDWMKKNSDDAPFTVHDIAEGLSVGEGPVRAHLNRYKDERFESVREGGQVLWSVREPEEDEDDDD